MCILSFFFHSHPHSYQLFHLLYKIPLYEWLCSIQCLIQGTNTAERIVGALENIRQKIGSDKLMLPSTACIIVNENGEVLMQERSDTHKWGVPGGILDPDETVLEGMKREVLEETGLTVHNPKLFGICSGPKYDVTYPNGDRCLFTRIVFLTTEYSGELKENEESLQQKFFALDDLPSPQHGIHIELLKNYRAYIEGKLELPIIE